MKLPMMTNLFTAISNIMKQHEISKEDFLDYATISLLIGFVLMLGISFGLTGSIFMMLVMSTMYVVVSMLGNTFVVNQISKYGFYDEAMDANVIVNNFLEEQRKSRSVSDSK